MSEPKPSSTGTGLIVGIIVAAVLGIPCLLGVLLFLVGGVFFFHGASQAPPDAPPPPIVAPPPPIVRDAEKAMPNDAEPETPQVPF